MTFFIGLIPFGEERSRCFLIQTKERHLFHHNSQLDGKKLYELSCENIEYENRRTSVPNKMSIC